MKMTTIASILFCSALLGASCTEEGPVTNPRQEEIIVPEKRPDLPAAPT